MRKIFLLISILGASPAWSASSGTDILGACSSAPGTQSNNNCSSYINGFVGGILVDQIANEEGQPICIPDGTTTDQVREIILKYAKFNPEGLRVPASSFVGAALQRAFPCKKRN